MFDCDNPITSRLVITSLLSHFDGRFESDKELLEYIHKADLPGTFKYFIVGSFGGYHVRAMLVSCNLAVLSYSFPEFREWIDRFLEVVNRNWLDEPENRPSRRIVDSANLPEGKISELVLSMADYIDRAYFDPESLPKDGFAPLVIPSIEDADKLLGKCVGYVCHKVIGTD